MQGGGESSISPSKLGNNSSHNYITSNHQGSTLFKLGLTNTSLNNPNLLTDQPITP